MSRHENECCTNCTFFCDPGVEAALGECRHSPPSVHSHLIPQVAEAPGGGRLAMPANQPQSAVSIAVRNTTAWPNVHPMHWCGAFRPKESSIA